MTVRWAVCRKLVLCISDIVASRLEEPARLFKSDRATDRARERERERESRHRDRKAWSTAHSAHFVGSATD